MKQRSTFGSKFGAVAVVGGSVVGLGNIWRFPYVAGENGGAAFILVYVTISLLISVPVMLSEFAVGRHSRSNAFRAIRKLSPHGFWSGIGYLGIVSSFIILGFYSVIAGWSLEFIGESIVGGFAQKSAPEISQQFNEFVASGWRPIGWTILFLVLNAVVVALGIEKGIERYNKILMPLMVLILIGLSINSASLSGFQEGVSFLLHPDFGKINGRVLVQALGQSFFSMSIGMGAMMTYGSYIKDGENLYRVGSTVAIADVCIAILSGLAIFPAVFSFGISPTSGPELVFITLPSRFAQMTGGGVLAVLFFVLLFFASITSSFSLMEVLVACVSEEAKVSRLKAVIVTFMAVVPLSILCALSQMPGSRLVLGGKNLFDLFDYVSSNFLLPLGGLAVVIFVGWVLDKKIMRQEFTSGERYGTKIFPAIRILIQFVIPVIITILFLNLSGLV